MYETFSYPHLLINIFLLEYTKIDKYSLRYDHEADSKLGQQYGKIKWINKINMGQLSGPIPGGGHQHKPDPA